MAAPSIETDLIAFNFNMDVKSFSDWAGLAPPRHGQSFMHELAREGDVMSAEAMLQAGVDIDQQNDEGKRPLHEAAFHGHLDMVEFLAEQGALVSAPVHPFGYTALYYAVEQGHADIVKYLLKRGALLGVEDRLTGQGLLHRAALRGDAVMAGILISAGIDVFREDKRGMTARDMAARGGHPQLERALLKVMSHAALYCV